MRALQQLLQLPSTATGGASAPASATAFSAALSSATGASAPIPSTASVGTGATGGPVPSADEIAAAAQRNGVDPALLAGLIRQESNFNAAATSGAGAQGLNQLMP